jgi:hypothetical protein
MIDTVSKFSGKLTDEKVVNIAKYIYLTIHKLNTVIGYEVFSKKKTFSIYEVNNAAYITTRQKEIKAIVEKIKAIPEVKTGTLYTTYSSQYKKLRTYLIELLAILEYENRRNAILQNIMLNFLYVTKEVYNEDQYTLMNFILANPSSIDDLKKVIPSEYLFTFLKELSDYSTLYKIYNKKSKKVKREDTQEVYYKSIHLINTVKDMVFHSYKNKVETISVLPIKENAIQRKMDELIDNPDGLIDEKDKVSLMNKVSQELYQMKSLKKEGDKDEIDEMCRKLIKYNQEKNSSSIMMLRKRLSATGKLIKKKQELIQFITGNATSEDFFILIKDLITRMPFI